ncbi:MAG: 3-oxoacyl-ACP reductase FabG [Nitrospirota bacterium]|nr:3-oxoacyl-ACP reductase FabG [Nitrospirota bacterium]
MTSHRSAVVIVTGASRGIGRAIALAFGSRKSRVVVNYRTREAESLAVVKDIQEQGGDAFAFRADVGNGTEVGSMVDETMSRWGAIDVLVNNAGITRDGLTLRMTEQDWDDVIRANLSGPFHCIRSVSRVMMKQRSGHIISLASISGIRGREGQANYAASKAGLVGLTKTAAKELGRFNIKVNTVLPGYVPTEMARDLSGERHEKILADNSLGRPNDPQEIAEFVHHLTTMKNVSGQVFNLDSRII